jgi:hypothetical protein
MRFLFAVLLLVSTVFGQTSTTGHVAYTGVTNLTSVAGGGGVSGGPALFFTDIISGPKTGGENNKGAYVTIYGINMGATQGASTITVGGGLVDNCPIWGATWQWYQKTVCQLGSSVATGNIVATVSGNASNTLPFTVRSGNIYCVSTSGNDANGGTFPSSCWRTIPKAKNTIAAGDIAYIRSGVSQVAEDVFTASLSMDISGGNNSGTLANPKAIIGYPGETATIGAYSGSGGQAYGMRTPNIGITDDYWVFAQLTLRGGTQAADISGHGWRMVGNDVSACCNTSQVGAFQFNGADHSAGQPMQYILGNEIHDSGPSPAADKFYHALYLSTDSNYFDVGWNHIHDNFTCRAIQVHSSPVCSPSCGAGSDTSGFFQFDLHFHHNKIHDDNCDGINLASTNPANGVVEIYNNLIYSVGKHDTSDGAGTFYCIRGNGTNNYARSSSGNDRTSTTTRCTTAGRTILQSQHRTDVVQSRTTATRPPCSWTFITTSSASSRVKSTTTDLTILPATPAITTTGSG